MHLKVEWVSFGKRPRLAGSYERHCFYAGGILDNLETILSHNSQEMVLESLDGVGKKVFGVMGW